MSAEDDFLYDCTTWRKRYVARVKEAEKRNAEIRQKEKTATELIYADCIEVPCPYCSRVGNPVTCPIPKIWYNSDDWGFTCMKCGNTIDSSHFKNGDYCGLKSNHDSNNN